MLTPIQRSAGINESEKILAGFGDRVFMELWTYPNVYYKNESGEAKELCDLMVVFGTDVILFQDKHCSFPDSGDLEKDWGRWLNRTANAGVRQIYGAERKIKEAKIGLYLDAQCKQEFPIPLPSLDKMTFHRVVIVRGAAERCREEKGGSGSLIISNIDEALMPFCLGTGDPKKGFVHIIDETALGIMFGYLDTFSDLVNYLSTKEGELSGKKQYLITGEEELIANYATHMGKDGEHTIDLPDADLVGLMEGGWDEFSNSTERAVQKEANVISGLWDDLTRRFTDNLLKGTSVPGQDAHGLIELERVVRWMASEGRTTRRVLAESMQRALFEAGTEVKRACVIPPHGLQPGSPYWVLLVLPNTFKKDPDEYRAIRQEFMRCYAYVVKYLNPDAQDIVVIGVNGLADIQTSEDALYLDAREWSEQLQTEAKRLHEDPDLHILQTVSATKKLIKEFPSERHPGERKVGRNEPCPCGSGKKYKKCHGK